MLFGGDPAEADAAAFEMLAGELAVVDLDPAELADGLAAEALARRSRAGQLGRATPVGGWRQGSSGPTAAGSTSDDRSAPRDLPHGRFLLVRRGKKRYVRLIRGWRSGGFGAGQVLTLRR